MPTVAVDKADLYDRLGRVYSTKEFDELCFQYGIELDEDTTNQVDAAAAKGLPAERPQLKIEIPANRYDLLCIEGIASALRVFLGLERAPKYALKAPTELLKITVSPETARIRPYFAGAVLRGIKFTQRSYNSFIDLQDKLHQNIGRRRHFVSIGTHDLDTITPPFRYEARPPEKIKFAPLNREEVYTAEQLMTLYESDRQLSKYLPIIRDSNVYPIIYDSQDRVLSMPPIINSQHSKLTLNTRNVFIDTTATDETKLAIVINMVALMFAEYCEEPFTIEPVEIIFPNGHRRITPNIEPIQMTAHASYVNDCTGLSLTSTQVVDLLTRMSLGAEISKEDVDILNVQIPPTRPDILHECDIMEDAAIAYGFNNLKTTFPSTHTVAQALPISKLSDVIRREWAQAGWVEVLPLILCSYDENFTWMNRQDTGAAVKIANPKTQEFQVVRTSLIPGLLKMVRENRSHSLPLKIFESSDITLKDSTLERQSRNERHAAAVWCNKTAGFEMVHGLLDRIMRMLEIRFIKSSSSEEAEGYYIQEVSDPTFFPGRAARVYYRAPPSSEVQNSLGDLVQGVKKLVGASSRDMEIGVLGILHPTVLANFDINFPCSALELNVEPFTEHMNNSTSV